MFDNIASFEFLPDNALSEFPVVSQVIKQRSLKSSISCVGVGLHSGAKVAMTLRPAAPFTGIVFRRTDAGNALIPASWLAVNDTRLNTCVANDDGVGVKTIEHLMSALAGMDIDNALIDIDGPEVPVMDGSAAPFVFMIECAGTVEQAAPRRFLEVLKRVSVTNGDKTLSLSPAPQFSMHVEIDFAVAAIRRQSLDVQMGPGGFKGEMARARTFGFEGEVAAMQAAGLGKGGSLENAVVIACDGHSVLNADGLRFPDEFVRHKALDLVGDLSLCGAPILGHVHAVRPGHAINNLLLRALFADRSAWRLVASDSAAAVQPLPVALSA